MSDDVVDAELDELRQSTERGSRVEDDSADDEEEEGPPFAIVAYEELDAEGANPTIAVRDRPYVAFLAALFRDELSEDRERVKQSLCEKVGIDPEKIVDFDRSEAVRLAMRAGFQEAAPDLMDEFDSARLKRAEEEMY
jgi:hypothetical protein